MTVECAFLVIRSVRCRGDSDEAAYARVAHRGEHRGGTRRVHRCRPAHRSAAERREHGVGSDDTVAKRRRRVQDVTPNHPQPSVNDSHRVGTPRHCGHVVGRGERPTQDLSAGGAGRSEHR